MPSSATSGFILATGIFCALAAPLSAQRAPVSPPTGLSPDVLKMGCAPALAYEEPPTPLRITGGQDSFVRRAHSTSDLVTINAGSKNGIEVGQEYFVRRVLIARKAPITRATPATIQTAGWIKVYAVDDEMSLATVSYACDTIEVNDYLEPLVHRPMPAPSTDRGKPERGNYGRVMTGNDIRHSFGYNDFFLLNRGEDFGITPGANFVIYRDKKEAGNFLYEIGEAMAVSVNADWSTLVVTMSRDAIEEGDYVGMRTK
jgi:hypothetical protein